MENTRLVRLLTIGLVMMAAALIAVVAAWCTRATGAGWPEVLRSGAVAFGGTIGTCAALVALYRAIGGDGGR
ncbi:hypothetical protein [Streptomyces cylindrosporus]|uniref:Uncharacterized protein n=1 Tax=Streptomyces cylindrosporus TaxID=2927583 RepID=A0ABS9Y0H1_9ACTN|nr:hypothetical protein [Streptomyces cylindrosporus]MCI3270524.1 hypothetical protein [Streptomyces cylindrosporus]